MSEKDRLVWIAECDRVLSRKRLYSYYPDEGPLRRELYDKHTEFFASGATHNERAYIGGNRVGKTHCVSYEATLHMLGEYPAWWVGRRFERPVTAWLAGEDAKAVRESLQEKVLGPPGQFGTGLVPGDKLVEVKPRSGIPDAIDTFSVKHRSGRISRGMFKSYEQGRESFQAAKVDVMVFDEEPEMAIYTEGLTRTMSTVPGEESGIVMCSFTPLKGISATVLQFLPGGAMPATEELRKQAWGWSITLALTIVPFYAILCHGYSI